MSHAPEPWKDQKCIKTSGDADCWIWQEGTSGFGYGNFHYGRMSIRAHRFSYQLHHGKIRSHDCVCHSCDNPKCVNPKHLWIGTRAENNADKEAKGRSVYAEQFSGEKNSNAALTTPEVIAIRVMSRKGMPQARIAKYVGVSTSTVCLIVNNERRNEETEQRVSSCVNACAGIDDLVLQVITGFGGMNQDNAVKAIAMQRDELVAVLEAYVDAHAVPSSGCKERGIYEMAISAIASVKGAA